MAAVTQVQIGDRTHDVRPFSGRKALIAARIMKRVTEQSTEIAEAIAEHARAYEARNALVIDRAAAQFRFPPRVVHGADAMELGLEDGATIPSRIGHLTEEDWERSGQQLRLPQSPSVPEQVLAVAPRLLPILETEFLQLVALIVEPNSEVKVKRRGLSKSDLDDWLLERGEDHLDEVDDALELVELILAMVEIYQDQLRERNDLPGRVGKALEQAGFMRAKAPTPASPSPTPESSPTDVEGTATETTPSEPGEESPTVTSTEPKPTSSTGSPPPTAGTPS